MSEETSKKKQHIIRKVEAINHPYVLQKVALMLEEADTFEVLLQNDKTRNILLAEEKEDRSVLIRQKLSTKNHLAQYDRLSAPWIFILATLSLVGIGILITAMAEDNISAEFQNILIPTAWLTGVLYLTFFLDFILMFYLKVKEDHRVNKTELIFRCVSLVLPPFRIGSRDIITGSYIWIPFWRWSKVTAGLFNELKKRFILPMILIALLIVPVLVVEWKFMDEAEKWLPKDVLKIIMEAVQDIVWTAFTFEFLLMLSVTNKKLNYCKKNWLDLLIILLPFVSFLRTFRFSQIARLKYATRSFKLRGVITKTREGLILIDFVRRILRLKPESELRRLQKMLRENEEERKNIEEKLLQTAKRLQNK